MEIAQSPAPIRKVRSLPVGAFRSDLPRTRPSPSRLVKILLYDGLGYFVVLTLTNLANILLYRGMPNVIETTGTSFEFAVTWIMSQRILIHPRDAKDDTTPICLFQPPNSHAIRSALRFNKGKRHQTGQETGVELSDIGAPGLQDKFGNTENDFDVQVRMVVDPRAQEKSKPEDHKDPGPIWDRV